MGALKAKMRFFVKDLCKEMLLMYMIYFLGDNIENVWYTTILAFGREYGYSLAGIECCQPVSAMAFFI